MTSNKDIQKAIEQYAVAYQNLEEIQKSSPLIPMGDQKTGSKSIDFGGNQIEVLVHAINN